MAKIVVVVSSSCIRGPQVFGPDHCVFNFYFTILKKLTLFGALICGRSVDTIFNDKE